MPREVAPCLRVFCGSCYALLCIVLQLVQRASQLISVITTSYKETNGMGCRWSEVQILSPDQLFVDITLGYRIYFIVFRSTSLSMLTPNALLICCAIRGQPKLALRCFNSTMTRTRASEGPFGPGFAFFCDENNR